MRKLILLFLALTLVYGYAQALEPEYFNVYKPKDGMSADDIMQIEYFVKYTRFAHDAQFEGKAYFVDKNGATRVKETLRQRITLGRKSDDIAYKDLVIFTTPQVRGMGTLTWTYMNPARQPDTWLWIPSLKKIRKISTANADDTFMGSDFTVEDILLRKFEDETYTLIGSEIFKGYNCKFDNKEYYKDTPCFVIEARPKKSPWYYSKRVVWVDINTGGGIYEEMYDASGKVFKNIFKSYVIYNVNGKEYPAQVILEGTDFRTGHRTVIINENIKFDTGLPESKLSEQALMQSRW